MIVVNDGWWEKVSTLRERGLMMNSNEHAVIDDVVIFKEFRVFFYYAHEFFIFVEFRL